MLKKTFRRNPRVFFWRSSKNNFKSPEKSLRKNPKEYSDVLQKILKTNLK